MSRNITGDYLNQQLKSFRLTEQLIFWTLFLLFGILMVTSIGTDCALCFASFSICILILVILFREVI